MAEGTAELTVPRLSGEADVQRVIGFLGAEARSRRRLRLVFADVGSQRAERVDSLWAEALSNALVAEFGGLPIDVVLPTSEAGLKGFARSGLLFALAQRAGEVTVQPASTGAPAWASQGAWASSWSPSDSRFRAQLFGEPGLAVDELIQREFVTFVNPHLAVQDEDLTDELTDGQVMPWALDLVGRIGKGLDTDDREALSRFVGDIAVELILNIGHAFRRQPGVRGTIPVARQRCYVQVYTTEGGGDESYNRLHLVVADAGHGIVGTLRPKLTARDRAFASTEPVELVELLLRNELPNFGRASGLGYRRIVAAVSESGGSMRLTTGSPDSENVLDVVVAEVAGGDLNVFASTALSFRGTTAHATIPVRPRRRRAA